MNNEKKELSSDSKSREIRFHDDWAKHEDSEAIDVMVMNESCTAPEMRWIHQKLGNIRGKRLLDVGCGLGEASVYFALQGANVTASDISGEMLKATKRLALKFKTVVHTHLSPADQFSFPPGTQFDIIYGGNLFHHVDIEQTIEALVPYLHPAGILMSWDPIAYNPAINVYRKMAREVRTLDEHPFTRHDIQIFRNHFQKVETRFFWFSTLIIFGLMYVLKRYDPQKIRYWKQVVIEGEKWKFIYKPLSHLDRFLLAALPPLKWLCWNVVIAAEKPKG